MNDGVLQRLAAFVDTSGGPDACWPFGGARNEHGYGMLRVDRRTVRAHRLALIGAGADPGSQVKALHSCDNPPCCNPAHLRWGTQGDNMRDAIERGRRVYESKPRLPHESKQPAGRFSGATECVNGHPFDEENTRLKPNSRVRGGVERVCRTCSKASSQKQAALRKAARAQRRLGASAL